jgi:hypothetical protein
MSARNIIYKDWVMKYGKQKNKINTLWHSQEIDREYRVSENSK